MSTTRNIIEGIKNVTSEGVTKAQVGLGSVDNTTDVNKPVSTATQTALNGKAPIASPVFTGDLRAERLIANGSGGVDTNVAVGKFSLGANTAGGSNTANGWGSLYANTTGSYNTANGRHALYNNDTGADNTALGYGSLMHNYTGNNNVAIGVNTLRWKQNGDYNTDLSNCTGLGYDTRVGGNNATAIGYNASAPANCVALGTSNERTLVGGAVDNGVDRLQVNGSISANSIKIPYADRVRITGRERCFKILSFASYYAGSDTSEAFIIDILDADYYDGISYRKILINRTGIIKSAFFADIDYSDSYAINLKTYNDNGVISLYLYTANYCDSCVLDFAYNRLNTTVNATSVGTNSFVPAGTLISSLL